MLRAAWAHGVWCAVRCTIVARWLLYVVLDLCPEVHLRDTPAALAQYAMRAQDVTGKCAPYDIPSLAFEAVGGNRLLAPVSRSTSLACESTPTPRPSRLCTLSMRRTVSNDTRCVAWCTLDAAQRSPQNVRPAWKRRRLDRTRTADAIVLQYVAGSVMHRASTHRRCSLPVFPREQAAESRPPPTATFAITAIGRCHAAWPYPV